MPAAEPELQGFSSVEYLGWRVMMGVEGLGIRNWGYAAMEKLAFDEAIKVAP